MPYHKLQMISNWFLEHEHFKPGYSLYSNGQKKLLWDMLEQEINIILTCCHVNMDHNP